MEATGPNKIRRYEFLVALDDKYEDFRQHLLLDAIADKALSSSRRMS
jgi:hypothetical protein